VTRFVDTREGQLIMVDYADVCFSCGCTLHMDSLASVYFACSGCNLIMPKISKSMMEIAKLFFECGFRMICADSAVGKSGRVMVRILFTKKYGKEFFTELPYRFEYNNFYLGVEAESQLLLEAHPLDMHFAIGYTEGEEAEKAIISILHDWVSSIEPEACRALLTLKGLL